MLTVVMCDVLFTQSRTYRYSIALLARPEIKYKSLYLGLSLHIQVCKNSNSNSKFTAKQTAHSAIRNIILRESSYLSRASTSIYRDRGTARDTYNQKLTFALFYLSEDNECSSHRSRTGGASEAAL